MSILAAYSRPGSNSEILKVLILSVTFIHASAVVYIFNISIYLILLQVNLLASSDYDKEYLCKEKRVQSCSMGG